MKKFRQVVITMLVSMAATLSGCMPCDGGCIKDNKVHKETVSFRLYCPEGNNWLEKNKIEFAKIVARKNGCSSEPHINSINKNGQNDYIKLSCDDLTMEFDCEFKEACWKKCWRMK